MATLEQLYSNISLAEIKDVFEWLKEKKKELEDNSTETRKTYMESQGWKFI